jgi:hypothetical protein
VKPNRTLLAPGVAASTGALGSVPTMKVGVYVDGFNLYFGAREQCGAGTAGWRWLDVRSLVADALPSAWREDGAVIDRVVYCTARVSGIDDPSTPRDQNVYLRALRASGSVDHIEFGNFVRRVKSAPLATRTEKGKPELVRSRWPVVVQDDAGGEVRDARFLVSVLNWEEKGSDVKLPRICCSTFSVAPWTPPSFFPTTATWSCHCATCATGRRWGSSIRAPISWPAS